MTRDLISGVDYIDNNDHPFVIMEHHTGRVVVDERVAPMIRELWDSGIDTAYSCQGGRVLWRKGQMVRPVVIEQGYVVITDRRLTSSAHRILTLAGCRGVYIDPWPGRMYREWSALRFNGLRG